MASSALRPPSSAAGASSPVCALCGLPAREAAASASSEAPIFCCAGCEQVYALLDRRGLTWRLREAAPAEEPVAANLDAAQFSLRGLWCASCAWGLERYLRHCPGIASARVDFLRARCRVEFSSPALAPIAPTAPGVPARALSSAREVMLARIRAWIADLGFTATDEAAPVGVESGAVADSLPLRAGLALFLAMGVMMLSWGAYAPALAAATGWRQALAFRGALAGLPLGVLDAANALGAALVVFICGWPILDRGARGGLRGAANMDTLIALGGLAAFALSCWQWARGGLAYFDVPAMLFSLLLLGRVLEARASRRAQASWERWSRPNDSLPAWRWSPAGGAGAAALAGELRPGDAIALRAGDVVPADCRLTPAGAAAAAPEGGDLWADESLLTGEPRPRRRRAGESLLAGTRVARSPRAGARAEVLRAADAGWLAEVARQVERARAARLAARGADRLEAWARWFVPAVALAAMVAFVANLAGGSGGEDAVLRAVTVLIFACPCTLGLALPLVRDRALTQAARAGLLLQESDALDRLRRCDAIVLDKTGTLTEGASRVTSFAQVSSHGREELLSVAAALEAGAEHPLGRAIAAFAGRAEIPLEGRQSWEGRGVVARWRGREWRIGAEPFAAPRLNAELAAAAAAARARGESVVFLGCEGRALAFFGCRDPLRAGAAALVRRWARGGRELYLASGDEESAAQSVAAALGIARARGGCSPAEKARWVAELRAQGRRVAFVGDGHNDAPALAQADVGVALARGAALPCRAAAITLLNPSAASLARLWRLAAQVRRRSALSLGWAVGYNLIGLPLAGIGWVGPLAAALAMVTSSLSLLLNALRPFAALKPRPG